MHFMEPQGSGPSAPWDDCVAVVERATCPFLFNCRSRAKLVGARGSSQFRAIAVAIPARAHVRATLSHSSLDFIRFPPFQNTRPGISARTHSQVLDSGGTRFSALQTLAST